MSTVGDIQGAERELLEMLDGYSGAVDGAHTEGEEEEDDLPPTPEELRDEAPNQQQQQAAEQPIKRGRGRPRKNAATAQPVPGNKQPGTIPGTGSEQAISYSSPAQPALEEYKIRVPGSFIIAVVDRVLSAFISVALRKAFDIAIDAADLGLTASERAELRFMADAVAEKYLGDAADPLLALIVSMGFMYSSKIATKL